MCTYMYVYPYLIKIYFFLIHGIFLNKRPSNQFKCVPGIQISLTIVRFYTHAHSGTCDKCDFMNMAGHGAINCHRDCEETCGKVNESCSSPGLVISSFGPCLVMLFRGLCNLWKV